MLASIGAKSMFMEEIKANHFEDGDLEKLRPKIAMGKSKGLLLMRMGYSTIRLGFVFLDMTT